MHADTPEDEEPAPRPLGPWERQYPSGALKDVWTSPPPKNRHRPGTLEAAWNRSTAPELQVDQQVHRQVVRLDIGVGVRKVTLGAHALPSATPVPSPSPTPSAKDRKKAGQQKGGEVTGGRSIPIKDHATQLLEEAGTAGKSWNKPHEAFELIEKPLRQFLDDNKDKSFGIGNGPALNRAMKRWIKGEHAPLKKVYERYLRKTG